MGSEIGLSDEKRTSDALMANAALSKRRGAPSKFTTEIADKICELIAQGRSVRHIATLEDMPCEDTIYYWLYKFPQFSEDYARAREAQTEYFAEQMRDIADTPQIGEKVTIKADGSKEVVTYDMTEHRKLQIETRKWIAGKMKPKKYGDSMSIKSEASINVTVQTGLPDALPGAVARPVIDVTPEPVSAADMLSGGVLPVSEPDKK